MNKSNEEKARELAEKYQTPCHGMGDCEFEAYQSALEAMQWKDLENRWHKISDGDFPKTTGEYLTVCRNKNKEDGIFLYEVVYYTGDGWEERTNWEDIIAWREIPEYK